MLRTCRYIVIQDARINNCNYNIYKLKVGCISSIKRLGTMHISIAQLLKVSCHFLLLSGLVAPAKMKLIKLNQSSRTLLNYSG